MRNVVEVASAGYAVTYLAGILAGFPWDKLASALTAIWFLWLLGEKAYKWLARRRESRAGPQ